VIHRWEAIFRGTKSCCGNVDTRCNGIMTSLYGSVQGAARNVVLVCRTLIRLFYFATLHTAIEYADRSTSLTHASKKAVDACHYYATLIVAILRQYTKDKILDYIFSSKHKHQFCEKRMHIDRAFAGNVTSNTLTRLLYRLFGLKICSKITLLLLSILQMALMQQRRSIVN
jgi:ADP-ribosylglycohydrolase